MPALSHDAPATPAQEATLAQEATPRRARPASVDPLLDLSLEEADVLVRALARLLRREESLSSTPRWRRADR